MRGIKRNWAKLAGTLGLAAAAVVVLHACLPARGATQPTLIITNTGVNQALITVSGAPFNSTFILWHRQFPNDPSDWIFLTNGVLAQTNFTVAFPPMTTQFYEAEYVPTNFPITLTMTILTPANGANVQ